METDHISRLLARDPLICYYEMVAKDTLPEVVSTYPSAFVCNTHDCDQPGEHWVAIYVDEIVDYFDPYANSFFPNDIAVAPPTMSVIHIRACVTARS